MTLDFALIAQNLPDVIDAAGVTALVWTASAAGGLVLGFAVALARRHGPRWLGLGLVCPVEILRGTPFLIQLFLLYFGGPFIGLSLDPVPAGLLGLTVYGAAYYSEIFRAGFEAVPVVRRIIVPEMVVLVLPALVNMTVVLLKETAVLSIITVPELTMVVSAIGSQFYAFVESLFLLALFYWGLVEACGWLGRTAEARLARRIPAHA